MYGIRLFIDLLRDLVCRRIAKRGKCKVRKVNQIVKCIFRLYVQQKQFLQFVELRGIIISNLLSQIPIGSSEIYESEEIRGINGYLSSYYTYPLPTDIVLPVLPDATLQFALKDF